jgi:molybdate transport system substrate-binding protein
MPRVRARRTAALLLAAGLLAAACGSEDSSPETAGTGGLELKVFAAASLTAAFTELGLRFTTTDPGTKVVFNFAGSQALATQIRQGAPADVFASADITTMDKVRDLVGPPHGFAGNLLQIVVERGNPKGVMGLEDLTGRRLKVVLAAPEVPAGRYAAEALGRAGVTVDPVSLEDSVKAVVGKVSLGEADAGIVYVTDVTAGGDKVQGVDIPRDQNVPAAYPIAAVGASRHQAQAQAFVDLVRSADGQRVLARFGFLPPPTS